MSPTNQDPITRPRADGADEADDADEVEEEVPPWPERGPEIAAAKAADEDDDADRDDDEADDDEADDVRDMTIPPPEPEPIPLPGPDPQPEPIPPPEPDPRPDPIPRPPGPDPAPEPGPVNDAEPVAQDVGTDEGSALRHVDDIGDEVDDVENVEDLELVVHEQPEVAVTTVDDDDVELEADDRFLDDLEPAPPALAEAMGGPLLPDAGGWEERWTAVQAGFVDDPGASIQQADLLVTEAMEELARILLAQRETLQDQWRTGEAPPDTEQLRLAVQGYRALLFGLLSA